MLSTVKNNHRSPFLLLLCNQNVASGLYLHNILHISVMWVFNPLPSVKRQLQNSTNYAVRWYSDLSSILMPILKQQQLLCLDAHNSQHLLGSPCLHTPALFHLSPVTLLGISKTKKRSDVMVISLHHLLPHLCFLH